MENSLVEQAAHQHATALEHLQSVKDLRERGASENEVAEAGREQFRLAYERELQALDLLKGVATEPLKSDIYSTAALAALGLGHWDEAERLAREGLAQEAPERTVRELTAVIDAAKQQRRLF